MLNKQNFIDCIAEQLKDKGFGPERTKKLSGDYAGLFEHFRAQGHSATEADVLASKTMFNKLEYESVQKAKQAAHNLDVHAQTKITIAQGAKVKTGALSLFGIQRYTEGVGLARAAIAHIEDDPRFSNISATTERNTLHGKYWALLADNIEHFSKGAFGTQRGKAGLNNVIFELFGKSSGDPNAKGIAASLKKLFDLIHKDFNNSGGTLNYLENFVMPFKPNPAKVAKMGFEAFAEKAEANADWSNMRWPDGTPIKPDEHADVLKFIYDTYQTDGAIKIDTSKLRGRGQSVGNLINQHRFMQWKGPEAWLEMHNALSDGNVFDAVSRYIENMSHRIALTRTFGTSPDMWAQNASAIVRSEAAKYGGKAVAEADAILKKTFQPMFDIITHKNPVDPNSWTAAGANITSDILTAAQLGSAALLALPGDFVQTLSMRLANGLPITKGLGKYMNAFTVGFEGAEKLAAQTGHIMEQTTAGTYVTQRFNGLSTYGKSFSRVLPDTVMRLSGMSRHTEVGRWAIKSELMGFFARNIDKTYEELGLNFMMGKYGIGPAEWDAIRTGVDITSHGGADFLEPINIFNSARLKGDKDRLYSQFAGMIDQEARYGVPGTTIEGQTFLRGTTRPDTLYGLILHSFGMYKNFPVSYAQIYGRTALAMPDAKSRVGFLAALGLSSVAVGALGVQMRNVTQGKKPVPMDTAAFWGKALLAGGGLSIWGDFLFSGINEYGRGVEQVVGGPFAGLLTDTLNLTLGDTFAWIKALDRGEQFKSKFASRGSEFLRRNAPGTSLWWARLALERKVWDNLDYMADPANAQRKFNNRVQKLRKDYKTDFYWQPGEPAPR